MNFENYILDAAKGKKVLEVGGLGNFEQYQKVDFQGWRSADIRKVAGEFFGIDIDEQAVEKAKALGLPYEKGNIEEEASILKKDFDLVVLIDVIEHVNNLGLAIQTIRNLLKPGGICIMSTPNPWSSNNFLRILTFRSPRIYPDHTCFITEDHFKALCQRFGLILPAFHLISIPDQRFPLRSFIVSAIGKIFPLMRSHSLVILKKP